MAAGSHGDTQPYIALGAALKDAGYAVRMATFENFRELVEGNEINFYPVRGDISKAVSSDIGQTAMRADNPLMVCLAFNQLRSLVVEMQQDFYTACADVDAIVYQPGMAIGHFLAHEEGIPAALATPFTINLSKFSVQFVCKSCGLYRIYRFNGHNLGVFLDKIRDSIDTPNTAWTQLRMNGV